MNGNALFDDQKTLYSTRNEDGARSTITIAKWAADLLQEILPNVHAWIQQRYDIVSVEMPNLSRVQRGIIVRLLAEREAQKNPKFKMLLDSALMCI